MKMASINSSDSFELKGEDHAMLQNMTTTTHEGVYNYIRINLNLKHNDIVNGQAGIYYF